MNLKHAFFTLVLSFVSASLLAQPTLLWEDFEAGTLPPGWSVAHPPAAAGWQLGEDVLLGVPGGLQFQTSPHGGIAYCDHLDSLQIAPGEDMLILPAVDLSSAPAALLTYAHLTSCNLFPPSMWPQAWISVSLDGGITWDSVATIDSSANVWETSALDLTPFCGNPSVKLAFVLHDHGTPWGWAAIDDVEIRVPEARDLRWAGHEAQTYQPLGPAAFSLTLHNAGRDTLHSLTLAMSTDGGPETLASLTAPDVPPNGKWQIPSSALPPLMLGTVHWHLVQVRVDAVNGLPDQWTANDTLRFAISTLSEVPPRQVLLEHFTATTCPSCTQAHRIVETLAAAYPELVPVFIHAGPDAMATLAGDELFFRQSAGMPSGMVDRLHSTAFEYPTVRVGEYESAILQARERHAPVALRFGAVHFDTTTRILSGTLLADFKAHVKETMRLNVYLVADSLVGGSSPSWAQSNSSNADSTSPFFGMGDPIVGYVHEHVLLASTGGADGLPGSLPDTIAAGENFVHSFSFTVPERLLAQINMISLQRCQLVGLTLEHHDDPRLIRVVNSASSPVTSLMISQAKPQLQPFFAVAPNPGKDRVRVWSEGGTLEVHDELGRLILRQALAPGVTELSTISWPSGLCMISIQGQQGMASAKWWHLEE